MRTVERKAMPCSAPFSAATKLGFCSLTMGSTVCRQPAAADDAMASAMEDCVAVKVKPSANEKRQMRAMPSGHLLPLLILALMYA